MLEFLPAFTFALLPTMAKFSESRSLGMSLKTRCNRSPEGIDGARGSAVGVVEPRVRSSCAAGVLRSQLFGEEPIVLFPDNGVALADALLEALADQHPN